MTINTYTKTEDDHGTVFTITSKTCGFCGSKKNVGDCCSDAIRERFSVLLGKVEIDA